ncbi:MAG: protein TolR [Chromatiales bacterium 21-64-14]|nr:MAG: protein TolR [Chromatiales bacterium 21-64-14]HQU16002.1 protein TolR [Gammaproteobacteria bacterium]
MSDINVVPYIDVMLVLLVIFMITAPLLTQGVKVDLPQAAAQALPPDAKEPLVVTVDAQGQYFLNVGDYPDKPVTVETLVNRVAAVLKFRPGTKVMMRADAHVDYGKVVTAMALLQDAGVPSVGLVTEPPPAR